MEKFCRHGKIYPHNFLLYDLEILIELFIYCIFAICNGNDKNIAYNEYSFLFYHNLIVCIKTSLFAIKVSVVSDEDHLLWLQTNLVVITLENETTKTRNVVLIYCTMLYLHLT